MESREEVMGPKDQTHVVKGKRTKRQRPQSPIPLTIATNSSSGDGGDYGSNGDEMMTINLHNTNSPPATTSGEFAADTATEEEEDMANCLILLAQGHSRQWANPKHDDHDHDHHSHHNNSTYKFTSKRYLETPSTTGNGKVGIYVYQCKTCSRTFPSFQALGGHRASHKKPKLAAAREEKKKTAALSDDEEPFSLQLSSSTNALFGGSSNRLKIHECSICGAEFSSGQALGGHMRRHRGPASTALSLTPAASAPPQPPGKPRNGLSLSLDLNLPAPEDHDHPRESKLAFPSKQQPSESKFALTSKQQQQQQQQSPLVLSATPTLVDCHY